MQQYDREKRGVFRFDLSLVVAASIAWIAFLVFCGAGCGGVPLVPPCVEQLAPGDTGELSWPCPGAPGYSYGCTGSPSQKPLIECEIDDGKVGHFRTVCVDACPAVGP